MGVDFYTCSNCGDTYCDCGYYVTCECGRDWCSDECAMDDGYTLAKCKLGLCLSREGFLDDDYEKCPNAIGNEEKYINCEGCENYTPTSCKYCRGEEFEDRELLIKAMELLNCDRQHLINKLKER